MTDRKLMQSRRSLLSTEKIIANMGMRFGAQGVLNWVCALPMFQVDGSIKIMSAR